MRSFLLIFGGLEVALLAFGIVRVAITGFHGDAAGQGMAMAFAIGGGVVSLLLLAPMLAMTWRDRSPWLCLVLGLLAVIPVLMVAVAE